MTYWQEHRRRARQLYWEIKKGDVFSIKIIQVLRSQPDASINKSVKMLSLKTLSPGMTECRTKRSCMAHVSSLTACCITEESRVFLTDGEKNLIYEANTANPPTVEVISKTFKNPTDVIFIREKPSMFSFVIALELVNFTCQAAKPLAQYSKISVDR